MKSDDLIENLKLLKETNSDVVMKVNGFAYEITGLNFNFTQNRFELIHNKNCRKEDFKEERPYTSLFDKIKDK